MKEISWSEVGITTVFPGVTKQVVQGDKGMVVRYHYAPSSVFPDHRHPEEQITIILKGSIAFEVEGRRATYRPGDVLVIPPGVPHGAEVVGDETVESLNFLSPVRTQEIEMC